MKITYLCLKNFASIYSAMRKNKIEIDFSKSKNKVCLLVGPNGSGKTSIISTLHPFAYSGNMDVRNNTNLILDEKDGYKEIHIQDNEDLYIIKHFYKYTKKQYLLKSFITKNGEELNPNGNVKSFNERVELELSIAQDYMKLIRLGSNVTNLINMKATERKNFTSLLLSDIDIYTEFMKKISEDSKVLRNLVRTVSNKIDRLHVIDEESVQLKIKDLEHNLEVQKQKKDDVQSVITKQELRIENYLGDFSSFNELENHLYDVRKSIIDINKKIESCDGEINNKFVLIAPGGIDSIQKAIVEYNGKIVVEKNMKEFHMKTISDLMTEKDNINNKMKYVKTNEEYSKLVDYYENLSEDLSVLENLVRGYSDDYNKETLLVGLSLLQQLSDIAADISSYNSKALQEVYSLMNDGENIERFVENQIQKIDNDMNKLKVQDMQVTLDDKVLVLFKPTNCVEKRCPYIKLIEDLRKPPELQTSKIKKLDDNRDYYLSFIDINKAINSVSKLLDYNDRVIQQLPKEFFNKNEIINRIVHKQRIFNEKEYTKYVDIADQFNSINELKNRLKILYYELKEIEHSRDDNFELIKSIDVIDTQIYGLQKTINDIDSKIKSYEETIKRNEKVLRQLERKKQLEEELKKLLSEKTDLSNELDKLISSEHEIHVMDENLVVDKQVLNDLNLSIKKLEESIMNEKMIEREFLSLREEKELLEAKFDDVSLIKESLSSTKGIPLLFIQLYLKNTKSIVNNLLSSVYGDDFEIDDFDINATEFNIPYYKNGIRINDVTYASQGEQSFLSLALSFALINQSIKDYNILLLDEIDSTLDTRNRAMFLNILEKQMESIDCEQLFLITHNNMFDNYPVDIIMTSDVEIDNLNNANIIFKR